MKAFLAGLFVFILLYVLLPSESNGNTHSFIVVSLSLITMLFVSMFEKE